jgi:Ion channel
MIPQESSSEYQSMEHAAAGEPGTSHSHAHSSTTLQSIGELEEVRTEALPSPAASLWSDLIPSNHFSGLKRRASTGNSTDTPKSARSGISIKAFFQGTFLGSTPEESLLPKQQQEPEEVKKKESKWAIVRRHVRSGHFLVHRSRSDDEEHPHHHNHTHSHHNHNHHNSNPNTTHQPNKQSPQSSPRRQQRLLQAYQQIHRRIHFSPAQCLWLIAFYVALSVLVFSFLFQKWTIIDSCYFAVVTFSTNGYGDLVPTTDLERMFTCLYVLSGVSFVAVALGMLGSNLIEAHDQTVAQAKKLNQYQAMSLFQQTTNTTSKNTIPTGDANNPLNIVQTYQLLANDEAPWYKNRGILTNVAVAFLICLLGYLIGDDQGWDLKTTIYYGIITGKCHGDYYIL